MITLTLADPPVEATHWTAAMMAQQAGISASAVRRIWRVHGLQPHRYRQFKLSNDSRFAEKLRDVVGLYVDLPAHAIVLSVDEKSQIQALDRTQPGLPLKKGRLGTMTHDYKRHGRQVHHSQQCELRGSEIRPKHFLGGHAKVDQGARTESEGQRHVGSIAAAGDQDPADARIIVAGVECVPPPTQKDLDPGGKVLRRMRRRQADVADIAGTIARREC